MHVARLIEAYTIEHALRIAREDAPKLEQWFLERDYYQTRSTTIHVSNNAESYAEVFMRS